MICMMFEKVPLMNTSLTQDDESVTTLSEQLNSELVRDTSSFPNYIAFYNMT